MDTLSGCLCRKVPTLRIFLPPNVDNLYTLIENHDPGSNLRPRLNLISSSRQQTRTKKGRNGGLGHVLYSGR